MGQQLCIVDRMQRVLAFQFNHDRRIDHQVRPEAAVEFDAIVDDWHWFLSLHSPAQTVKFVSEAGLVSRFEQARAEPPMNCYSSSNNFVAEIAGHKRILSTLFFVAA